VILIAHRGNISGPNKDLENNPDYLLRALDLGYSVEIDVWYINNTFLLGHDFPVYEVEEKFLMNERIWCHAKNLNSLEKMLLNSKIHCFWHQTDDYTITSKGYIWAYPGKKIGKNTICVMPENTDYNNSRSDYVGVCSDFVEKYLTDEILK